VIVFLFFLWYTVSFFWSIDPESTLGAIETFIQMAGFMLILWDLYTTPEAVRAGLQAYVLGAYVSIASAVANYLAASQFAYGRYSATGFQPNSLGFVLALGIPLAWHLAASGENGKKHQVLRFVNYAFIPAAIFAISLTATRFAMLAILPAFLFGISTFVRLKPFPRVLIFVILAGALFALPSLIPRYSIERLATTTDELGAGDLSGRVTIWQQGLDVFAEHPLLGVGGFAFPMAVESGRSAHNSFLVVLVELGIMGFVLFGIVLAMAVYNAIHQQKWDARFWLTILLVWALGGSAMSWAHAKPTWLFLSLLVAAANASVQPVQSKRGSQFPVRSPGVLEGRGYEAN
jgi:O-antigen ligase